MSGYLCIEARLPRPAALELAARLEAARPRWDPELTEAGFRFFLPRLAGRLDGELTVLEEGCRQVERGRDWVVSLEVTRAAGPAAARAPAALGPWPVAGASADSGPPEGDTPADRLSLPPEAGLSGRRWAGESLLAGLLTAHFTPPPGASKTSGRPTLALAAGWSPAPLAALLAGSGPITFLAEDETTAEQARRLAELNGQAALFTVETSPFKTLARQNPGWAGRFGLILVHLSPYLAARRLKTLTPWLAPGGVILAAGFAPGLQTAHLLRAAGRGGLELDISDIRGDWAAVSLRPAPARPVLPPLTGSVVPALADWPEAAGTPAVPLNGSAEAEAEEPDEESLWLEDETGEDED